MLTIIVYGFLHGSIFKNRIKLFKEILYTLVKNTHRIYRHANSNYPLYYKDVSETSSLGRPRDEMS